MHPLPPFSAVVPAAGIGQRYGASVPKQYLQLDGRSVLEHCVERLLSLRSLQTLVLAVAADDDRWRSLSLLREPRIKVVHGGAQRAESVLAGIEALGAQPSDAWVLVHDVARPCVPLADIHHLLSRVAEDPVGGLLAVPVHDTVKQVTGNHVAATLDRAQIWRALTPQLFRHGILREALVGALADRAVMTDESSAVERLGYRPQVISGSACNIKITVPGDLELAAFYLQQESSS